MKHRLQGPRAQGLWLPGSRAQDLKLWCVGLVAETSGILPDEGSDSCLLHWEADSLPLGH